MRGIAIVAMILAHTISFFYTGSNPILLGIKIAGNTIAFTTFLFIFSTVAYLSYLKDAKAWPERRSKLIKRTLLILGFYYFVAIIGSLKSLNIFNILILKDVPGYTEFILTFILFNFLFIVLYPVIKILLKSLPVAAIVSILIFCLGQYLATINFGFAEPYKILFSGGADVYRFPLMQYFPILMLGLAWGSFIDKQPDIKHHKTFSLLLSALLIPLIGICFLIYSQFGTDLFLRWPPQIGFLLIGCLFVFILMALLSDEWIEKTNSPVKTAFMYLSFNALPIYVYHTLLLFLSSFYFGIKSERGIIIGIIFILVTILSVGILQLEEIVKRWLKTRTQNTAYINKK